MTTVDASDLYMKRHDRLCHARWRMKCLHITYEGGHYLAEPPKPPKPIIAAISGSSSSSSSSDTWAAFCNTGTVHLQASASASCTCCQRRIALALDTARSAHIHGALCMLSTCSDKLTAPDSNYMYPPFALGPLPPLLFFLLLPLQNSPVKPCAHVQASLQTLQFDETDEGAECMRKQRAFADHA
jgi:hypothetical protein